MPQFSEFLALYRPVLIEPARNAPVPKNSVGSSSILRNNWASRTKTPERVSKGFTRLREPSRHESAGKPLFLGADRAARSRHLPKVIVFLDLFLSSSPLLSHLGLCE